MPTSFAVDQTPQFIGALEQYLINGVGDTLYYAASEDVSLGTHDGFLDPGERVRLSGGPTWVVSGGSSTILTEVIEHAQDTTNVHGITDTADLAGGTLPTDLTNLPTSGEKAALAGTGTPGASNKYVTQDNTALTNSRAPSGSAGGDLTGTFPNPTISTALNDAAVGTPSLRTLGTGATQAAVGSATVNKTTLTTTGDTFYASSANTPARRAIGTAGQVLTVSGGVPVWAAPASAGAYLGTFDASGGGHGSPAITDGSGTTGDFYVVSVAGTVNPNGGAFSVVAGDQVRYSGTVWQKIATGGASGVSTITTATQSGVSGAVTINSAADVGLGNVSNLAQVTQALADAKGDIIAASGADTFVRVPVGTNGYSLQADSSASGGVSWIAGQSGNTMLDIRDQVGGQAGAATGNADNAAAIQRTATAAADGAFIIPSGTFKIKKPIVIPSRTTVFLLGKLQAVDTFSAAAVPEAHSSKAMLVFCTASGRNTNGLVWGGGQLLCNNIADYGIQLDSSHGFRAMNIEINDAVESSIHVWSNEGDASSSDCDDWVFDQITHRHDSSCKFNTTTLSASVTTTSATSWTVADGTFAGSDQVPAVPFWMTCQSETVKVTNIATNTLTVVRGEWDTTAATHTSGTTVTPQAPRPKKFVHTEPGSAGGVADGTFRDSYIEGLKPADHSPIATVGALSNATNVGTFTVDNGAEFTETAPFFVSIDNEIIKISAKSGNTLTVPAGGRGQWGTTGVAAAHAVNTKVYSVFTSCCFWIEDASRIKIDGKVISDNGRAYGIGVLFKKATTTHSMEGNEVLDLYIEAQHSGPTIGVLIYAASTAPATYFTRWHKIDKLRFDTNAGTKGRRLICANDTGTGGYVTQCVYKDPRNTIGSSSLIIFGPNVTGCSAEVLGTTGGEGAFVVDTSGNNNVHGLMSGGRASPGAYTATTNY